MIFVRLTFVLGLFLVTTIVFAVSPTYPTVSATWGSTFESGQSDELVYRFTGSTTKLSELQWPIPPTLGVSVAVDVDWTPWLTTSLELTGGAALSTGTMTDDDWNIFDLNGNLLSRVHSDSTAYQTANWSARFEATFPLRSEPLTWSFLAGVLYRHLAWEAWNPTQIQTYAANGAQYSQTWTGLAIIFRQDWVIPYVGAAAGLSLFGIDWNLALRTSPLVQTTLADSHVLRSLNFNENLSSGWLIEPEVSMEWPLFHDWSGILKMNFQEIFGLRGDQRVSTDGATPSGSSPFSTSSDTAGAGLQSLKISFLVHTKLGGHSTRE